MGSLEERVYEIPAEVNNLVSCKYSKYGCLEKVICCFVNFYNDD